MERKLRKFSVAFDFGNNEVHSLIWADCMEEALDNLAFEIDNSIYNCQMARFGDQLINPTLLQTISIKEVEEQEPEQTHDPVWQKALEYEVSTAEARIEKIARQGAEITELKEKVSLLEAKLKEQDDTI